MKMESGRRIQLGEPIMVGTPAMIPYEFETPTLVAQPRRTQGDRRIPPQIERPAEPARRVSIPVTPLAVMVALSGLAFAIAMFSSHVVG
jgi:hypothetical protein